MEGPGIVPASHFNDMGAVVNVPMHQLEALKKAYVDLESSFKLKEQEIETLKAQEQVVRIELGMKSYHNDEVWDEYTRAYATILKEEWSIQHVETIGLDSLEAKAFAKAKKALETEIETMRKERDNAVEKLETTTLRLEDEYLGKHQRLVKREKHLDDREDSMDTKDAKTQRERAESWKNKCETERKVSAGLKKKIERVEIEAGSDRADKNTAEKAAEELRENLLHLGSKLADEREAADELRRLLKRLAEVPLGKRLGNWKHYVTKAISGSTDS